MDILTIVILLFILFFSVVLHEYCHGLAAYANGDDTARLMGRLTLNPIPHIDPVGTILLPVIMSLSGTGFIIGWAKPVPINPLRFRDLQRGMIQVGFAGVAANIALGTLFCLILRVMPAGDITTHYIRYGALINFILAIFNLVPIPPLDGSRILTVLLPWELHLQYQRMERYGMIVVMALALFGGLSWLSPAAGFIVRLLSGT